MSPTRDPGADAVPQLSWRARVVAVLSASLMLLAPGLISAPSAHADSICERLGYGASCRLDFGNPGNSGAGGSGGSDGPRIPRCNLGSYGAGKNRIGVPCSNDAGLWSNAWGCYVLPFSPQPEANDPVYGEDIKAGRAVYRCVGVNPDNTAEFIEREARAVPGTPPTQIGSVDVDGRDQLERALGTQFNALFIGMAPVPFVPGQRATGSEMGVVGLPTWLWTTPTPFTPFDVEMVDTGGTGYRVEAHVVSTTWDMGDGSPKITCSRGEMVEYQPWMKNRTPTCGHTFDKPGRYYVNMWTNFRVTWVDSNGPGGELIRIRRGMVVRIGESQVVNR